MELEKHSLDCNTHFLCCFGLSIFGILPVIYGLIPLLPFFFSFNSLPSSSSSSSSSPPLFIYHPFLLHPSSTGSFPIYLLLYTFRLYPFTLGFC